MKLKLDNILDAGNLEKERVSLKAGAAVNIGKYLLAKGTELDEKSVANRISDVFWIPDREIKDGDLVVIYSKKGKDTERKNDDGTMSYFFYLGAMSPQWVGKNTGALVLEISEWMFKKSTDKTQNKV